MYCQAVHSPEQETALLAILQCLASPGRVSIFLPCMRKLLSSCDVLCSDTAVMNTKETHYGKKCVPECYSSCYQAFYLCPGFAATSGKQCRRSHYAMQSHRLCKADAVKPDTKQSVTLTLSQIDY